MQWRQGRRVPADAVAACHCCRCALPACRPPTNCGLLFLAPNQVAGYKVKVMLAEPKTRRGSGDAAYLGLAGRGTPGLPQGLLAGMGVPSPYAAAAANATLLSSLNPGLVNQGCVFWLVKLGYCCRLFWGTAAGACDGPICQLTRGRQV